MIIPLYKPYGASTHLLAKKYGELVGEPATHTGTLDPGAEGVVVVLTGKDRFKKTEINTTQKTYDATFLLGFETDSHDLLGLSKEAKSKNNFSQQEVEQALYKLTGTYQQALPTFSAKRIKGKSYFDLAREEIKFDQESFEVNIDKIKITLLQQIKVDSILSYITKQIPLIQGDFRQQEVLSQWKVVLSELDQRSHYQLVSTTITCSKRTYIRAVARDLGEQLNTKCCLFSLTRTKNGPYSIADCLCLV